MRWLLLAPGAALALAGCTSATRLHRTGGYDRNVISREEILQCDATDALSLVRRLRGEFLTNRGRTSILLPNSSYPAVYVDQIEFGRFRLQYNNDRSRPETDHQFLLQYTISIGAHRAHQY